MTMRSTITSEFETTEQETNYGIWLKNKVQSSLNDTRENIPHDEAMARVNSIIYPTEAKIANGK